MRERLQLVWLFAALLAVAAFLVSFIAGIGGDADGRGPRGEPAQVRLRSPRIRVEVLNAGARPGMAREATARLRDDGFDVVFFGNGRPFEGDSSVAVDRVGNPEIAAEVADVLGIQRVRSSRDESLLLEVTVVLGSDWPPAPVVSEPDAVGGWRDLFRRFRRTP